jgi:hypothetical protein
MICLRIDIVSGKNTNKLIFIKVRVHLIKVFATSIKIKNRLAMKKDVPNICSKSNVSLDFSLAFGSLTNYLERVDAEDPPRTRHLAMRTFFHRVIPRYEEFFDPEEYDNVVNNQNSAVVEKINNIVDKLNELRSQKISDFEVLHPLKLVLGSLLLSGEEKPC